MKYKCGHSGDPIFLDDNELSMLGYLEWKKSVGYEGDCSMCWECYCKKGDKNE